MAKSDVFINQFLTRVLRQIPCRRGEAGREGDFGHYTGLIRKSEGLFRTREQRSFLPTDYNMHFCKAVGCKTVTFDELLAKFTPGKPIHKFRLELGQTKRLKNRRRNYQMLVMTHPFASQHDADGTEMGEFFCHNWDSDWLQTDGPTLLVLTVIERFTIYKTEQRHATRLVLDPPFPANVASSETKSGKKRSLKGQLQQVVRGQRLLLPDLIDIVCACL
jgi:hypothetical protein